jgi:protein-S-isoprenylcysteine O-methyltransferase Ste14
MTDSAASRGPGIRCPPPLIFLAGLLAAWRLDRWLGLAIDGDGRGPLQSGLGWLLVVTGLGVLAWSLATLVRFRTTFHPDREASRLVVAGPYRYSRNPIYVGMTASYTGVALLANTVWPFVLLPVVLVLVTRLVIGREERYLARTFGEEYSQYCRRVGRWF